MTVVDLFAGPGGWDHAAKQHGLDPIGFERDPDACATRTAAGLTTIRADLLAYQPPHGYTADGLIASPPCPAFSASGNGQGRDELPALIDALQRWGPWIFVDDAEQYTRDGRALGAPLYWADSIQPRWVLFEQVPPVLPFWEAAARWLETVGYSTWAGILNAADYGVPQNRKRAILIAHRDRPARPPQATHAQHPQPTLWGDTPEHWVTMGDALGWDGELSTGCDWQPDGTSQTRSTRQWWLNRPATTVQGDARIWPPGHKLNSADIARYGQEGAAARYSARAGADAIKVEPWQAGILQSFPADYPWQGTKTSQAQQIGNAVPPTLAYHLLEVLL